MAHFNGHIRVAESRPNPVQITLNSLRDVYLGRAIGERDGLRIHSTWVLSWKGQKLPVQLQLLTFGGGYQIGCWGRHQLSAIQIPTRLENSRQQILKDLKDALASYKETLSYETVLSFELVLDA